MRPPPVGAYVECCWRDSHGGNPDAWFDGAWLRENAHEARDIVTVGHLVQSDAKGLVVVLSKDLETGSFDSYIFIPLGSVVSVRKLR